MNSLLPPSELEHLLIRAARPDEVTLGMPHLSMNGLSETWLLKECGHRHWAMLAAAAGRAVPDFRDQKGNPIYAAFLSVSVREAAFETAGEHDRLRFTSRLARISRSRFMSLHRVEAAGRPIGEIAMTSTFVRRAEQGRNRAIVRTEVPALRHIAIDPGAAEAAGRQSGHGDVLLALERYKTSAVHRFVVDPCPSQDFNGADFLYFASYPAFVDRAEWAFFRPRAAFATSRRRDILYRGNIDPGERIIVTLAAFSQERDQLAHLYRLATERDQTSIAEIYTVRALARREPDRSRGA